MDVMRVAKRDYGSAADHSAIVTNDDRGSARFPANAVVSHVEVVSIPFNVKPAGITFSRTLI